MLTHEQLIDQLALQDRLNSQINPDWLTAGYPWHRAIMVEAVEAIDHYGWKWWKKQEPDIPQVQMELVDIWHFVLSATLVECGGDRMWAAESLLTRMGGAETLANAMPDDTRVLFDAVVSHAASGQFSTVAFAALMRRLELSWDALHAMYVAKNVLNIFRQEHGYKDGTYTKVWNGREDNQVLADLILASPGASAEHLFVSLETIYSQLPTKETP